MNRKKLSTLLIVLGILIASIPFAGRFYMNYQQEKMYAEYLSALENVESTDILDADFNDQLTTAKAIDPEKVKPRTIENVIGRISLPAISSDQLLLEGSSSKELRFGAGHIAGSALPGETGNCAIAAHRNYTFGSYFNRLGEAKVGDKITIEYNKTTYTYLVSEILIVLPSDVSILKKTEGASVTLITCHPKGASTHRLVVKGTLS